MRETAPLEKPAKSAFSIMNAHIFKPQVEGIWQTKSAGYLRKTVTAPVMILPVSHRTGPPRLIEVKTNERLGAHAFLHFEKTSWKCQTPGDMNGAWCDCSTSPGKSEPSNSGRPLESHVSLMATQYQAPSIEYRYAAAIPNQVWETA